jgi:hypothetical protein
MRAARVPSMSVFGAESEIMRFISRLRLVIRSGHTPGCNSRDEAILPHLV